MSATRALAEINLMSTLVLIMVCIPPETDVYVGLWEHRRFHDDPHMARCWPPTRRPTRRAEIHYKNIGVPARRLKTFYFANEFYQFLIESEFFNFEPLRLHYIGNAFARMPLGHLQNLCYCSYGFLMVLLFQNVCFHKLF